MRGCVRLALIGFLALSILPLGCARGNSKRAVQEAIEAHLKQQPGLALSNMTTEVQDVKFDGDKATAQVVFQSKEAAEVKVEVRYTLRRQGNRWEVESSTPMGGAGANPHGAAVAPASGQPTVVPTNPPGQMSPQPSH